MLPAFYLVGGSLAAWRLGRTGRFDIVHVHWPVPHMLFGWAARAGARWRRAATTPKLIAHFYSVELRWVRHRLRVLSGFLRRAITTADRVVAISTSTGREIEAVAPVPVEIIPYAVDLPHPSHVALPPAPGGTRPLTLLSVGRLVERKGVRYLIEAVALLPATLDARLVVIGDGPERAALEAQARELGVTDRVAFRGWVSPAELDQAYADASVFALPAVVDARGDTEGLGMVLLEAMTYKIPVVATPLGGITDIVTDERTGLLVAPNSARALADGIARLATDPALASRLADAGQIYARDHFSWESVLAAWRALYASVAPSVNQPPAHAARSAAE
jgi:glycosyltransferase involved in cell wall biosynthesis